MLFQANFYIYLANYSILQTNLECIVNKTEGCVTESFHLLFVISQEIISMFNRGECVSKYGDPLCGTSAILSLGHVMQNPYKYKTHICRQYEVTGEIVEAVTDAELCNETEIAALHDSYTFASQQLEGYCVKDAVRICEVKQAQTECLEQKTWLVEGASECRYVFLAFPSLLTPVHT